MSWFEKIRIFLDTIWTYNLSTSLLIILGFALIWTNTRRLRGVPPGPWPVWPLVGNILAVGTNPRGRFEQWRKIYGDTFSLYFGNRLVIVLNGYDVLKEALVKYGEEFSYRPNIFFFEVIDKGIAASSGSVWKEQRKFILSAFRNFGIGKSVIEDKINEEAGLFVQAMGAQQGQSFELSEFVHPAVSNVICSIVFGKRFDYHDPLFLTYLQKVDENVKAAGVGAVLNVFPLARYLPGDIFKFKRTMRNFKYVDEYFIKPAVEEHLKCYDEENTTDFISAYIKEIRMRERLREETSFSYESLIRVISDLFLAGTETTTTTLRWAVLFLIRQPHVQERCFAEIKSVIGLDRFPQIEDKLKMPYVEATIAEIQRLGDITPFSLFRTVSRDLVFMGYTIPKGVIVIPNLSSVLKDPYVFEDPDDFRPERFLDSEGSYVKCDQYIPFALGKRNCLGESLARAELFLFLTAMIQQFKFQQPEGADPLDLEPVLGSTSSPKPFKVLAVKRLP